MTAVTFEQLTADLCDAVGQGHLVTHSRGESIVLDLARVAEETNLPDDIDEHAIVIFGKKYIAAETAVIASLPASIQYWENATSKNKNEVVKNLTAILGENRTARALVLDRDVYTEGTPIITSFDWQPGQDAKELEKAVLREGHLPSVFSDEEKGCIFIEQDVLSSSMQKPDLIIRLSELIFKEFEGVKFVNIGTHLFT